MEIAIPDDGWVDWQIKDRNRCVSFKSSELTAGDFFMRHSFPLQICFPGGYFFFLSTLDSTWNKILSYIIFRFVNLKHLKSK